MCRKNNTFLAGATDRAPARKGCRGAGTSYRAPAFGHGMGPWKANTEQSHLPPDTSTPARAREPRQPVRDGVHRLDLLQFAHRIGARVSGGVGRALRRKRLRPRPSPAAPVAGADGRAELAVALAPAFTMACHVFRPVFCSSSLVGALLAGTLLGEPRFLFVLHLVVPRATLSPAWGLPPGPSTPRARFDAPAVDARASGSVLSRLSNTFRKKMPPAGADWASLGSTARGLPPARQFCESIAFGRQSSLSSFASGFPVGSPGKSFLGRAANVTHEFLAGPIFSATRSKNIRNPSRSHGLPFPRQRRLLVELLQETNNSSFRKVMSLRHAVLHDLDGQCVYGTPCHRG